MSDRSEAEERELARDRILADLRGRVRDARALRGRLANAAAAGSADGVLTVLSAGAWEPARRSVFNDAIGVLADEAVLAPIVERLMDAESGAAFDGYLRTQHHLLMRALAVGAFEATKPDGGLLEVIDRAKAGAARRFCLLVEERFARWLRE